MITDERRKAFEAWFRSMYGDSRMLRMRENPDIYDWLGHQVPWQAWQAAQQIKPLEWVEVSDALKVVKTICGEYAVFNSITVVSAKFADDEYYSRLFHTEAEAIAAANEDYQRRVLSCLVWGVV